jgi:hypothetical protein
MFALQEVEAALQGSQGTASKKQLKQLHGRCMLQLEDLVELIRGPLSDLERKVGRLSAAGFLGGGWFATTTPQNAYDLPDRRSSED